MELENDKSVTASVAMLLEAKVRVFRKRWTILLISGLVVMSNSTLWISMISTATVIKRYYVPVRSIVTISVLYFLASAVMAIPGAYCVSRHGSRVSILICAACSTMGSAFRVGGLARDQFIFLAIGQLVISLGTIFALITPTRIAAVWFPSNERTFATTFGMIMNILGVSVGFLMSTCMIPDSESVEEIGGGIRNMLVIQTLLCFILFVFVLAIFLEKPAAPSCISQSFRQELVNKGVKFSIFRSLLKLMIDKNYILVTMAYSLNYIAVFSSFMTLPLMEVEKPVAQLSNSEIPRRGWIGFISTFPAMGSSVVVSFMLDRHKRFKQLACALMLLTALSFVILTGVMHSTTNTYATAASFTLVMICGAPYLGAGLDHLADIAYPISEGWSCLLPMILANVGSLTTACAIQATAHYYYHGYNSLVFSVIEGFAFVLLLFVKGESGRDITYLFEELGIKRRFPDL